MDIEYVGRVLARLQPFVRGRVIRRTRIERVLGTLKSAPEELHAEVDRLLAKAGIAIHEDVTPIVLHEPMAEIDEGVTPIVLPETMVGIDNDPVQDFSDGDGSLAVPRGRPLDALVAARQRLETDRHTARNLAKVLLRADEEVGLSTLVRGESGWPLGQGDFARLSGEAREAAECLLLHNQGLVHLVAKRFAPTGMTHEDLFQHGVVGLMRAVELFDPSRGNKFSTYAMHWVRQSITRGIANEARMIRLPVHMHQRVIKVWSVRARLRQGSEEPSVHQLALACELSDEQVLECLIIGPMDVLSLDTPIGPEGETTLGDVIDRADPSQDPEGEVEFSLLQELLHEVLDTLDEREAGVVSMRFGLADGEPHTLDEIGKVYGVTRERIRQIETKVMVKLRHPSRSQCLRPYMYGGDYTAPRKAEAKPELEADEAREPAS